eukprot:1219849-Amphidinium_carterae.1
MEESPSQPREVASFDDQQIAVGRCLHAESQKVLAPEWLRSGSGSLRRHTRTDACKLRQPAYHRYRSKL